MRVKSRIENISYLETQHFFDNRMKKYNQKNPYSLTMYQDKHPELVNKRNRKEVEVLLPFLNLDASSRVLDVACGIGRWSDAITTEINEYCGIDFCEGFINLATERNKDKDNRYFYISESMHLEECLSKKRKKKYNRVLLVGSLMYLNDEDVIDTLKQIIRVVETSHSIICIREPIGLLERLTLKEYFSEELSDTYNAIYRTKDELIDFFNNTFLKEGFRIINEGFLFEDNNLNNRKETEQYYFILMN